MQRSWAIKTSSRQRELDAQAEILCGGRISPSHSLPLSRWLRWYSATVYINTKDLVKDVIAGNGISVGGNDTTNNIAIKLATGNESFLTVDSNGLKLSGVQTAINTAVNDAKDTIDAYTVNGKEISTNPVLAASDIQKADGKTTIEADLAALHTQDETLQTNINSAKTEVIGTEGDESTAVTIYGAKKYADEKAAAAEKSAKDDITTKIAQEVEDRNQAIANAVQKSEDIGIHYYKQSVSEGQSVSITAATHKWVCPQKSS